MSIKIAEIKICELKFKKKKNGQMSDFSSPDGHERMSETYFNMLIRNKMQKNVRVDEG